MRFAELIVLTHMVNPQHNTRKQFSSFNAQSINLKCIRGRRDSSRFSSGSLAIDVAPASPLSTEKHFLRFVSTACTNRKISRRPNSQTVSSSESSIFAAFLSVLHCSSKVKESSSDARKVMEIYLSLLVVAGLSWHVCAIQFDDDDGNLGQPK